jgi:hypothetical protein
MDITRSIIVGAVIGLYIVCAYRVVHSGSSRRVKACVVAAAGFATAVAVAIFVTTPLSR